MRHSPGCTGSSKNMAQHARHKCNLSHSLTALLHLRRKTTAHNPKSTAQCVQVLHPSTLTVHGRGGRCRCFPAPQRTQQRSSEQRYSLVENKFKRDFLGKIFYSFLHLILFFPSPTEWLFQKTLVHETLLAQIQPCVLYY